MKSYKMLSKSFVVLAANSNHLHTQHDLSCIHIPDFCHPRPIKNNLSREIYNPVKRKGVPVIITKYNNFS